MDTATVFSDNPVQMAKHWASLGARRLHIVDLNGAVAGKPKNEKVIREMIAAGGLNSVEDVQAVCAKLVPEGVIGAIAGRALYEGKLELKSAQAAADKAVGKA